MDDETKKGRERSDLDPHLQDKEELEEEERERIKFHRALEAISERVEAKEKRDQTLGSFKLALRHSTDEYLRHLAAFDAFGLWRAEQKHAQAEERIQRLSEELAIVSEEIERREGKAGLERIPELFAEATTGLRFKEDAGESSEE